MIKYNVNYKDWNGNERTDVCRFNINEVELRQLNAKYGGNLDTYFARIYQEKDEKAMMDFVLEVMRLAYGVMDDDGVHFRKSEKIWEDWVSSPSFEKFFVDTMASDVESGKFIKGVLPAKLREAVNDDDATAKFKALRAADVTLS